MNMNDEICFFETHTHTQNQHNTSCNYFIIANIVVIGCGMLLFAIRLSIYGVLSALLTGSKSNR